MPYWLIVAIAGSVVYYGGLGYVVRRWLFRECDEPLNKGVDEPPQSSYSSDNSNGKDLK